MHRPAGQPEVVEHRQVFQERGFDIDGQRVDRSAAVGSCDLHFLVGQWRDVEKLRNALAPFDFDQQHLPPTGGQRQRQGGSDGRLAGSALAGDEVQSRFRQAGRPADRFTAVRFGSHQCMLTKPLRAPDKLSP